MAAVMTQNKNSPEHCALSHPVQRPGIPCCILVGEVCQTSHDQDVHQDVKEGADNALQQQKQQKQPEQGQQWFWRIERMIAHRVAGRQVTAVACCVAAGACVMQQVVLVVSCCQACVCCCSSVENMWLVIEGFAAGGILQLNWLLLMRQGLSWCS